MRDLPDIGGRRKASIGLRPPSTVSARTPTMSIDTTADLKVGHTQAESSGTNTIVADLQCGGWRGWDARDVLAGRLDDATVRQAVEVGR